VYDCSALGRGRAPREGTDPGRLTGSARDEGNQDLIGHAQANRHSGGSLRTCPLCGEPPRLDSRICSPFSSMTFQLGRCDTCGIGLVLDPRTDFADLYGPEYYAGKGADPWIDYVADEAPGSIREIEWRGIVRTVADVVRRRRPDSRAWSLLDWGAGLGGLVRTARQMGIEADGLDEGYAATVLAAKGLLARPIPELRDRYDVVTAIEVVEHLTDPLPVLRAIASCLKPGGFIFITTGNLAKAPTSLDRWQYARIPDVHVTFWSPRAWAAALGRIGLDSAPLPIARVDSRIVQYKVMKALPRCRRPLAATLPMWRPAARVIDSRFGVSDFPIGVRPVATQAKRMDAAVEVGSVGSPPVPLRDAREAEL
jgi:SAM-dependent methyltransferase